MYYQDYDEYIRGLMRYPSMPSHMCPCSNIDVPSEDLEKMYPEIYRIIYPMVCFSCDNLKSHINEHIVDMMTDDIYDKIESDERIKIYISLEIRNDTSESDNLIDNRQFQRPRNRFLRDIIKILLLRELLHRRPHFPMRPYL